MTEEQFYKFEQDVWRYLNTLQLGDDKNIANIKNLDSFIRAIKSYIDLTGCIEFNSTYTRIRRIQSFKEIEEQQAKTKLKYESFRYTPKLGSGKAG